MSVVNKKLRPTVVGRRKKKKLIGSDYSSFSALRLTTLAKYKSRYTTEVIDHLLRLYGSEVDAFLVTINDTPELQKRMCSTQADLFGQVVWAIDYEQAVTLNDVIFGRTSLGLLGITDNELSSIAELMAAHLNWPKSQLDEQLDITLTRLSKMQAAIKG